MICNLVSHTVTVKTVPLLRSILNMFGLPCILERPMLGPKWGRGRVSIDITQLWVHYNRLFQPFDNVPNCFRISTSNTALFVFDHLKCIFCVTSDLIILRSEPPGVNPPLFVRLPLFEYTVCMEINVVCVCFLKTKIWYQKQREKQLLDRDLLQANSF